MSRSAIAAQAWQWLENELEHWSDNGRRARFWWRDDDASAHGERLDRLLELSGKHRLPVAIAAVPARLEDSLAERLQAETRISVLQHGYAHTNHALPGQRSLELGGSRAAGDLLTDLERGFAVMRATFGERFLPVLVPPWNRFDAQLCHGLANIGFHGVSTHKARRAACPAAGLLQVNTHLDPVHWRHDNGFVGVYPAVAMLVQHLVARRGGYRDADEPTGILSHHLVQNDAVWQFLDDLLQFLSKHPAVEFVGADDIWK